MVIKGFFALAPFFLSIFLALVCTVGYLMLRKRYMRRSPLADRQIDHVPGQQLVQRTSDHEAEILLSMMMMYMALPLAFMAWVGARVELTMVHWGTTEWTCLALALALFCLGLYGFIRHVRLRGNVSDGLLAERVTGMQLNKLVAHDCLVLHDLPCEGFNIDHVVIAPRGIYAVETKSFRKPKNKIKGKTTEVKFDGERLDFDDFSTAKPIEQARRQAHWLSRYLREAMNQPVPVNPAVALPGWYVVKSDSGKASDVFVFTPMGRGCDWFTYGAEIITTTKRHQIAQSLATRYPTVS